MKKIIFLVFFLAACSEYKTPDLPDLNRKSFSTENVLQKQKELKEKVKEISNS